jgi:hypothetical protein
VLVQVIERMEDAGAGECIEFRPYRSPRDAGRILARWSHSRMEAVGERGAIGIGQHILGTPIDEEFQRVLQYADSCGVPFVWIKDPLTAR